MSRIALEPKNTTNLETKRIFSNRENIVGSIPDAYCAFGRHSHILQANWNKTIRVLSEGNLPHSLKESIALAVSEKNGCNFCVHIHEPNLLQQGFSEDHVLGIKKAIHKTAKIDFVLKFCVQATSAPAKITA